MKYIFLIISLLAVGFKAMAEEEIYDYKIEVGQFDRIRVTDNVNVVYRYLPDSTGYAQYRGKAEFDDAFILTAKGDGKLKIQVNTQDVGKPDLPTLYIYSDFLSSVENSSNFVLKIESTAPCSEFKATQVGNGKITVENIRANKVHATLNTGNGTVNVSGKCDNAYLKMVGAGMIAADRLQSEDVQCTILGTGSIGCWATENLSVKGIGSTKIYYKGEPKIKKSGGGKLFELPAESGEPREVAQYDGEEENEEEYEAEEEKQKEIINANEEEEPQTVVTWEDD